MLLIMLKEQLRLFMFPAGIHGQENNLLNALAKEINSKQYFEIISPKNLASKIPSVPPDK
jgi:hypothetical protein